MQLTIEINQSVYNQLDAASLILWQNKNTLISQAILEKLEELEDCIEAKSIYDNPTSSYKTLEQIEKEIALEN